MKQTKSRYLLLLIILFSCGQKNTDDLKQTFSYQLDTVLIDSKGKNLDLTRNITNASVYIEKNTIYLFNKFDHGIDEIDLNQLEYVQSIPFDKEGPNGTSHINYLYALDDDLFFIKGSVKSGVFDKKGNLLKGVDWSKVNEGDDFQMIRNELIFYRTPIRDF